MSTSANPLPRSNAADLPSYVDKSVLVIGKLNKLEGTEASFVLNDGEVLVHVGTAIEPLQLGSVYQILGKVVDDSSLKAHTVTQLPTSELPPADFEKRLLALRKAPLMKGILMPDPNASSGF